MGSESLFSIFLNTVVVNNFVLALFLGICPFLGTSAKKETAWNMGLATTFVMVVSSVSAYGVNWLLVALELEFLRLICYIAIIASAVQLVEMFVKKFSPALFQTAKEYDFVQSLVYSLGAGAGFILALMLMAGLRERLELARVPTVSQGAAMSLMLAGLLSLAFMGFAGLGAAHG